MMGASRAGSLLCVAHLLRVAHLLLATSVGASAAPRELVTHATTPRPTKPLATPPPIPTTGLNTSAKSTPDPGPAFDPNFGVRLDGILIGHETDITVVVSATGPDGEEPRCVGRCFVNAVLVVTDE